ncbi:Uncharacterised protein [Escherichia coli]|uniref:Uncharacterized protein n=1 Tax=Escherichia coli TaxID=562 RepID=A0A447XTQ7_ECOLX|nr:Uncharacterised protein [Escherichia coli]
MQLRKLLLPGLLSVTLLSAVRCLNSEKCGKDVPIADR